MPDARPEHEGREAAAALLEALLAQLKARPALARAALSVARWLAAELERSLPAHPDPQAVPARASDAESTASESVIVETRPFAPPVPTPPVPTPLAPPTSPAPAPPSAAPAPPRPMVIELGGSAFPIDVPPDHGVDELPAGPGRPWRPLPATARPTVVTPAPAEIPVSLLPPDLELIAIRSRLKAEACRWLLARRREIGLAALDLPPALHAHLHALLERGKALPQCFLWMIRPGHVVESDHAVESAAEAFDNLALVAELLHETTIGGETAGGAVPTPLLEIAAETQSALVACLSAMNRDKDLDQQQLFLWLREHTQVHKVFISRHMKLDDPADPANWRARRQWLEVAGRETLERRNAHRRRGQILGHVRYHAAQLASAADEADSVAACASILHHLQQWADLKLQAADRDLRSILAGVIELLRPAAQPSPEVQRVLDAVRLGVRAEAEQARAPGGSPRPRTSRVLQAADLLRGRVVVFIGGDERDEQKAALERDLELAELRWIPTVPHEALYKLHPHLIRPDVDLVLLPIRLTSHCHGELERVCDQSGKPFVRLPRGWNPAQVAEAVLEQASQRLRRETSLDSRQ